MNLIRPAGSGRFINKRMTIENTLELMGAQRFAGDDEQGIPFMERCVFSLGSLRAPFLFLLATAFLAGCETPSIHELVKSNEIRDVERALDDGVDVDSRNQYGATPLHLAVQHNDIVLAELLLNRGAKVDARQRQGATPLHIAAHEGLLAMAELLLGHGADLNARNNFNETPMQVAYRRDYPDVVAFLKRKGGI